MAGNREHSWSVLIVRVWFEDQPSGFRARVIYQGDGGGTTSRVFATPEAVETAVSNWLQALQVRVKGIGG